MTETIESIKPIFALLCPALASILILLSDRWPNLREAWTLIASILQFFLIFSIVPIIAKGQVIEYYLITNALPQVHFGFRVDAFGLLFAIIASFLWIVVSIYSIGYMRTLNEHSQTRYYLYFSLAIFGAMGVAISKNLVTLFVFYEILTVSTYPLVAHEQSPEAIFAGRKYLAYLITSSIFLLAATAWTYSLVGTTDFTAGGILKSVSLLPSTLFIIFCLFILGFMKAAYIPFHSWLPTAMVAPAPVSALLHAVAVVKAGVFGIVRIVCYIFGINLMRELGFGTLLSYFAAVTMIGASLFAIAQDNLKKRLAYSTMSQLSYIIFGVGLLSPMGITGAMLHIPFHGLMKITLFLCAGSIFVATGKKNITELRGIGKTMPYTMLSFMVGSLGMCGIPPMCGFLSKWFLGLGTLENGQWLFLSFLLLSSFIDVVYFFPIIYIAFFDNPLSVIKKEDQKITEAPLSMTIPLCFTAFLSVFVTFPNPITNIFFNLAKIAVRELGGV